MGTCLPNLSRLFHRPKPAPPREPPGLKVETYTYSTPAPGVELKVDVHLPLNDPGWPRPTVLFFHGGGLLYGNREFFLRGLCGILYIPPHPWFAGGAGRRSLRLTHGLAFVNRFSLMAGTDDCTKKGWVFLTYDYRKLIPFTGHNILADLNALFSHYHTVLVPKHNLSVTNVFVAGYSAGGYVAQLAAAHWEPKPLGMFLVAAQGGKVLSPFYFGEKEPVAEVPEELKGYLNGGTEMRKVGPLLQLDNDKEEFAARLALAPVVWSRGLKLDLLTGIPGLSKKLREAGDANLESLIPEEARCLFPELLIDESFPPAYVVHGEKDATVLMEESEALVQNLGNRKVIAELIKVDGAMHQTMCFDAVYRSYMAGVINWLEARCVADEGEEEELEEDVV